MATKVNSNTPTPGAAGEDQSATSGSAVQTSALELSTSTVPAPVREIPPLPGGGSWTFDESLWEWVSNEPVSAEQTATAPSTTKE